MYFYEYKILSRVLMLYVHYNFTEQFSLLFTCILMHLYFTDLHADRDAAHRVLPLGALGLNLGLGDAGALAACLLDGVLRGEPLGVLAARRVRNATSTALAAYEARRQRAVMPVAAAIEAVNAVFSSTFTPLVLARSLGVAALDAIKPFKESVVRAGTHVIFV